VSLGRVDGVQITLGLIVVIKECNCCLWVSVHCVTLILLLCSAVVVVVVAVVHSRGSSGECEGRGREQADTHLVEHRRFASGWV
jgi:hypothetical protein